VADFHASGVALVSRGHGHSQQSEENLFVVAFCLFSCAAGVKPRVLHVLGEHYTTELYLQPQKIIFDH
jgi:hypothetical protein